MKNVLALLASLSIPPSALAQTTWYVDAGGTAPGSGTLADPYVSIQHAALQPSTHGGDTLLVAPGTYVENILLLERSIDLRIHAAEGPTRTTVQGSVYVEEGPYDIAGFTIRGNVILGDSAIRHCVLIDTPRGDDRGIFHWGDVLIERCTLVDYVNPIVRFAFDSGDPIVRSNARFRNGVGGTYGSLIQGTAFDGSAFWNADAGDYRLAPGSVLIDTGSPSSPPDPDGSPADVGAFAYDPTYAPTPFAYCVGKPNGQGCVPSIGATGVCSASGAEPFLVVASQVSSQKFGRLFYGSAPAAIPFVGGTRCVATPFVRTPLSFSGGSGPCTGALSYDFHALVVSGADPALVPGRLVYAQYWYRDPLDPAGFGLGLSDAIGFAVAP